MSGSQYSIAVQVTAVTAYIGHRPHNKGTDHMRNFVILFEEKEGTSPVVRLLDNFEEVAIVHQVEQGWEPFNAHNAGALSDADFARCLDIVWGPPPIDLEELNRIYTPTATAALAEIAPGSAVGFKMRFQSTERLSRNLGTLLTPSRMKSLAKQRYREMMFDRLAAHEVVVFMAVRQDVFRWALSKYHGDGTGKRGHLQFKLASGEISRDDIASITIDCDQFEELVADCEQRHARKRTLIDDLATAGIRTGVLRYEDFLADQYKYFEGLLAEIECRSSRPAIESALTTGTELEKVHSDDISDFVTNHEEVMDRFSHRFVQW